MEITDNDRFFYTCAVDQLTQKFEISREFVRNNGMPSLPLEELRDLMITGIKEWLGGSQGEQWLGTLGYSREPVIATLTVVSGCVPSYAGFVSMSGTVCPSCSGIFPETHGRYCECCGKLICDPCMSIVDPIYQIGWCPECIETHPLTNLLVYSE